MKIQKVDYTINNYSMKSNQNQKENPTFGKLFIENKKYTVPTDILQSIIKNEELRKMVRMFHNIGKDIELSYCLDKSMEHLYLQIDKNGREKDIITSFHSTVYDEPDISQQINNLLQGFAEKTFNNYLIERQNKVNKDSLRQEVLNSFVSFNKSLDQTQVSQKEVNPKQSFWQRLFGKNK